MLLDILLFTRGVRRAPSSSVAVDEACTAPVTVVHVAVVHAVPSTPPPHASPQTTTSQHRRRQVWSLRQSAVQEMTAATPSLRVDARLLAQAACKVVERCVHDKMVQVRCNRCNHHVTDKMVQVHRTETAVSSRQQRQ